MMNDTKTYDVAIIGSGPGGYVAAIRAAQLGLSVLLVEKDSRLGGVCTLRGCIPTKALLHTADLLEETRHGAEVGVSTREVRLELAAAMKHKEKVVRQSSNGITFLMKKNDVKVVNGFGRIAGTGKVSVAGSDGPETLYSAKNILIATGSTPRSLPGIEIDHKTILSSDSILEVTEIPKSFLGREDREFPDREDSDGGRPETFVGRDRARKRGRRDRKGIHPGGRRHADERSRDLRDRRRGPDTPARACRFGGRSGRGRAHGGQADAGLESRPG